MANSFELYITHIVGSISLSSSINGHTKKYNDQKYLCVLSMKSTLFAHLSRWTHFVGWVLNIIALYEWDEIEVERKVHRPRESKVCVFFFKFSLISIASVDSPSSFAWKV